MSPFGTFNARLHQDATFTPVLELGPETLSGVFLFFFKANYKAVCVKATRVSRYHSVILITVG